MFDYHVHSHFSPDASMNMEEAIEAALARGVTELCFTDHIDYDFDGNHSDIAFEYQDYFSTIDQYRKKYENRITIKYGVEFGLQPHLTEKYRKDALDHPFDFIICSIHSVAKSDLYSGNFFENRNQPDAYCAYFNDLIKVINHFDNYSIIGHMDVIKRYGSYDMILPLEAYRGLAEELLKAIIEKGKGIELNTSGIRYQLNDWHPSIDILKLYRQLGGEIITLGSDSHRTEHLAFDFPKALKALSDIGFKYITTFDQMKPSFHAIEKLL
ncbi:histidinol-phosphatase HisJ family protein [Alkaliphilus crotonatoxidans]